MQYYKDPAVSAEKRCLTWKIKQILKLQSEVKSNSGFGDTTHVVYT